MKYFFCFFYCIFAQIILAQTVPNKTLIIDYQLIKSNITSSKLASIGNVERAKFIIKLKIPSGEEQTFEIEETSNFAPELAAKHPEIQTFAGICLSDKFLSVRFDISPLGYSATYFIEGKIIIIEAKDLSKNLYSVVPYDESQMGWECGNSGLENLIATKRQKNIPQILSTTVVF